MTQDFHAFIVQVGIVLLVAGIGLDARASQAERGDGNLCGDSQTASAAALTSRGARVLSAAEECALQPKESFKECDLCPEMVVVPAGSFEMGGPESETLQLHWDKYRRAREHHRPWPVPKHEVRFARPFAVGRFAVTFAEWDACAADGGCAGYLPSDSGAGRGRQPVINVSWGDAQAYVAWLSRKTGRLYRLLSEAEREYVTRAGTTTPYWWGSSISRERANYGEKFDPRAKTVPVGSFDPNPWGFYQVHGNIDEWVEDCRNASYAGAPADGSAWTSGECSERMMRGGTWSGELLPESLRSFSRESVHVAVRSNLGGFRVARTLGPVAAVTATSTAGESEKTGANQTDACRRADGPARDPIALPTARPLSRTEECALEPKDGFKECDLCPDMVIAPAGSFLMGVPDHEAKSFGPDERDDVRSFNPRQDWPAHEVRFAHPFAVGRFAVTFEEWDACVDDGGCGGYRPAELGFGRGRQPVINVSWDDAKAYVSWLSRRTGGRYRLLSEAEREYVTRAGTTTPFWWGSSVTMERARYRGMSGPDTVFAAHKPYPVDTFAPNPWGLYHVHGNVWEWSEDCWDDRYPHAPSDGAARTSDHCTQRILRGGSWTDPEHFLRSGSRYAGFVRMRSDHVGFRVARTMAP